MKRNEIGNYSFNNQYPIREIYYNVNEEWLVNYNSLGELGEIEVSNFEWGRTLFHCRVKDLLARTIEIDSKEYICLLGAWEKYGFPFHATIDLEFINTAGSGLVQDSEAEFEEVVDDWIDETEVLNHMRFVEITGDAKLRFEHILQQGSIPTFQDVLERDDKKKGFQQCFFDFMEESDIMRAETEQMEDNFIFIKVHGS